MLGTTLEVGLCPPPAPSVSMSFSWLFLGELVSTRSRFRFTNRRQDAVHSISRSSIFQRTANTVLFDCLSGGVHPKGLRRPAQGDLRNDDPGFCTRNDKSNHNGQLRTGCVHLPRR